MYDENGNCISSCNDDDPDIDGDGILNEDDDDVNGDGCLDDGVFSNEECQTCGCSGGIIINILEDEDYVAPYTVFISSQVYDQNNNLIYESDNSDGDLFNEDEAYIWFNEGDLDDDNDGLFDYEDPFPFDSDNDGIDDCIGSEYDCDNDGLLNNGATSSGTEPWPTMCSSKESTPKSRSSSGNTSRATNLKPARVAVPCSAPIIKILGRLLATAATAALLFSCQSTPPPSLIGCGILSHCGAPFRCNQRV